jgi:hypothetical protein
MKNFKLFFIVFFFAVFITENFSLPRFALRGGGGACIDCHVNPTGGNMRHSGGWSFSKNVLPMVSPRKDFEMSNKLNENIEFGFDFRGQYLVAMSEDATRTDFQRMTGSVYTSVAFTENINAFARYDFIWQIWEAYAVAHILPNNSYIKGGTFQPNFGIRMDDHTAYTRGGDLGVLFATGQRQGLIYEPRYVETGIEVGAFISDIALLTASVGNPRLQQQFVADPTYTASLQINPVIGDDVALMFGGSFVNFKDRRFNQNTGLQFYQNVNMYGGFFGLGIYDLTLMAEYDMAKDYIGLDNTTTALMIEAAYRIIKGIEAIVRYDRFDFSTDVTDDELSRLVLGFEIFPYSFIEIRPQYRIQMEKPSVKNDAIVVQFHFYY